MQRLCQSASQEHSYFQAFRLDIISSRNQDQALQHPGENVLRTRAAADVPT